MKRRICPVLLIKAEGTSHQSRTPHVSFEFGFFFIFCEAHASHLPNHLGGDVTEIFVQERLVICGVARQLVKPVEQLCLNSC